MMSLRAIGFWLLVANFLSTNVGHAGTLDTVRKKGFIQCGVSQGLPGFSSPNDKGEWTGIDVDLCRAVAAAVLGSRDKVKFSPLSAKERFTALQSGEIDILARNTTYTLSRDVSLGLEFPAVLYYDGQGFMVPKKIKIESAAKLNGATVCVNLGTTTELNVADYFRAQGMKYKLITFEKLDEVIAAYEAGRCDVYSADQSALYANRLKLKRPDDHLILKEMISKEPLSPAVRQGDPAWARIVRWSLFAMLEAEELGVGQKNVATFKGTKNPAIARLLGQDGDTGKSLGLSPTYAATIVTQVGNYEDVFERNLGQGSPLKIQRGLNALWNKGGLHYPMPNR